jgi:hypothetical protein
MLRDGGLCICSGFSQVHSQDVMRPTLPLSAAGGSQVPIFNLRVGSLKSVLFDGP